ncbi:acyloxyacyl hydrolase [Hymenobacter setariae]|uniref:acyloxyacyl hydrolase n=1 Tax=Hymenobacter setariae TaxID=2594794 RepID=UPI001F3964A4|nr:acyloxyacyl hydrolase [Hymenobacter setariae]
MHPVTQAMYDSAAMQAARPPLVVGAYAQGSFILKHTAAVNHLAASHPTGFELNVQRQTTGAAAWHGWYKYPKAGLALVYYDYHNPALGQSYAATVYLSKSFLRTQRQDLSFRLGTGLAWFTSPFDLQTNRKNVIVSSSLNATLQLRLEYDYALTPHLGLLLGVALNHYSNGATTKPNFGINLPSVVLGLNYHQQRPASTLPYLAPAPADVKTNFLLVSTSLGYKQRELGIYEKYLVNSLTIAAGRRVNRKSNLLVGLEGFYDRSLLAAQKDTARNQAQLVDVKKAGIFLGHELLFGRLAFVSHLGFYVYNPYKSNGFYYERLGLRYQFTNVVFGAVDLKIHRGTADVIEFKVGAKLARRPTI